MSLIHVMDTHLSNMIAAGEVVERPANIVKECAENALDAGASSIQIEVFEGGIAGVIITDDGCGMEPEDARLAFERHATSKLHSEEELFSIGTMGFRGEALPSIAAVASVDLKTSMNGQGTHVRMEFGECTVNEPVNCPRGTRIEVRDLFVKVPARYKYLRRPAYEFSVIADLVNKMALSRPDIRFSLFHDGRQVFRTSGKGDQKEILYQMYGREVAENAVPFAASSSDFEIDGLAVQPKISRASKNFIYLTVNGRLIRSWQITKAVMEGYREYLPKERCPIVFLNIQTDPQLVDVNVHPNKWEVRIAKEEFLKELITETLEGLFAENLSTPEIRLTEKADTQEKLQFAKASPSVFQEPESRLEKKPEARKPKPEVQRLVSAGDEFLKQTALPFEEAYEKAPNKPFEKEAHFTDYTRGNGALRARPDEQTPEMPLKKEIRQQFNGEIPAGSLQDLQKEPASPSPLWHQQNSETLEALAAQKEKENARETGSAAEPAQTEPLETEAAEAAAAEEKSREADAMSSSQASREEVPETPEDEAGMPDPAEEMAQSEKGAAFFDHLKIIGQLMDSYILCENPNGLVIIDQHAAQERFNFEQLDRQWEKPCKQKQPLMVPLRIPVTPDLFCRLEEINQQTAWYGIEFEAFGTDQFILREEPLWFGKMNRQTLLEDMLGFFRSHSQIEFKELRRRMTATTACHSSIRFNRPLSMSEMEKVISDLRRCRQPYHCPHGRPTVIQLTGSQLRKEFERG